MGDDEKQLKEDLEISGGAGGGGTFYCPNCGLEGVQGANFCPNCGVDLSSMSSRRGGYDSGGNSERGYGTYQQSRNNQRSPSYQKNSNNYNGGYSDSYY